MSSTFFNKSLPHPQNTYTNAEKLLAAAEELAHTGECNPDEIYNVARRLDSHIESFASRVQQRNRLLNMAVLFYTHEKEVRQGEFYFVFTVLTRTYHAIWVMTLDLSHFKDFLPLVFLS